MNETVIRIGAMWHLAIGLGAAGVAVVAVWIVYHLSAAMQDKSLYRVTAGAAAVIVVLPCLTAFVVFDLDVWNWVGAISPALELAHINLLKTQ